MSRQQDINQTVMSIITDERVLGTGTVIRIGATCIAEINGMFFLIVEIMIGTQNERILVIRISEALAAALERAGIVICQVTSIIPTSTAGREVELECSFLVDNDVILVFIVRNTTDDIVLVRVPLCTVLS